MSELINFGFAKPCKEMNNTLKGLYISAVKNRFNSLLEHDGKLTEQQFNSISCCNDTLEGHGFKDYIIDIEGVEILKERKLKKVATWYDSKKFIYI